MSQTMKRDAREAMPATEPRDAEQAGVVEERLAVAIREARLALDTAKAFFSRRKCAVPVNGHDLQLILDAAESAAALAAPTPPQPTPEAREAGDGALERLEVAATWFADAGHCEASPFDIGNLAADLRIAITRARAADAAEAALKPFAAYRGSDEYINNPDTPDHGVCAAVSYRAGDYRRARALLTGSKQ